MIVAFVLSLIGLPPSKAQPRSLSDLFRKLGIRGVYFAENDTGLNAYSVVLSDLDRLWRAHVAPDRLRSFGEVDDLICHKGADGWNYIFHQIEVGADGQPVLVLLRGDEGRLERWPLDAAYALFGLDVTTNVPES